VTPLPPAAALNLSPARWVWLPSRRTLANTFVLFRREIVLEAPPASATGWVLADSRYRLTVNGRRVQWGPPPADPRHPEADPLDLTPYLTPGRNVLGIEVLYYGHGEGTWPLGKPGLILRLDLVHADGHAETIATGDDGGWLCCVDRSHPPGQYRRWYLRALQEVCDLRLRPIGWDAPGYEPGPDWGAPQLLPGIDAAQPPLASGYPDYATDMRAASPQGADIRPRCIPLLTEEVVPAANLAEAGRILWKRDPNDWFEFRAPNSLEAVRDDAVASAAGPGAWTLPATGEGEGVFATFVWDEQAVGWPCLTVDAAEGTIVELMPQEAHDPANGPWLDTHFFAWSRFVCREGANHIEPFDFECLRWLQVHVRAAARPVTLRAVALRRRRFPWPHAPVNRLPGEPALQRLMDASVNTLHNAAQETIVDGMGRERQQYSGDCGHQLHLLRGAFGETRLSARFLSTYSHGLSRDGYFLDCWPAFDRLARVMERQVGATGWGPLLDHGVGFVFDCWHHYRQTGDQNAVAEPYPALTRFADYLYQLRRPGEGGGLLPVEEIGVPAVWIDHQAYRQQRHKQCAFNLYAAAMYEHALAPLARAFGDAATARRAAARGRALRAATVARFWDATCGLFVANLPWLQSGEETELRLCDRSLATALLYNQMPGGADPAPLVAALAERPAHLGISYPANAVWRMWALADRGRADAVLQELREDWATMPSVLQNNTLAEFLRPRPDSTDEWSHCPIAPLLLLHQGIAGIQTEVSSAGGRLRVALRPQLCDLPALSLVHHTPRGPVTFDAVRRADRASGHDVTVSLPPDSDGRLYLPGAAPRTLLGGQTHRFTC